MSDSIHGHSQGHFDSKAVLASARPLVEGISKALEGKFGGIVGGKNVKTVDDILLFMRSKVQGRRVTVDQYKEFLKEMYEGAPDTEACERHLNNLQYTRHYLDAQGTLDANQILCNILLLYSGYGPTDKARLLFTAFDANDDGFISREEMKACLGLFFATFYGGLEDLVSNPGRYPTIPLVGDFKPYLPGLKRVFDPAKIPTLVDKAFTAADKDNDGRISKAEWLTWTEKEGALTEEWGSIGVLLAGVAK
jgi:Ca2+-binding EF-hand superfamily protein